MHVTPKVIFKPFLLLLTLLPHFLFSQEVDSLKAILDSDVHDTVRVRILIGLGKEYESTNFDQGLQYYQQALRLSRSDALADFPRFEGLVLENIGFAYYYGQGKSTELISYLQEAMNSHSNAGLLEELSKTEFNLATFYANFSKYDSAVYHYDRVITRNKANDMDVQMATSLSSSGLNSYYLRDLDKAAESLLESIRYSRATGDTARIYAPYMNYALVLKEQGQFERAKEYIKASLEKVKQIDYTHGIALSYTNIGQILIKQDSLDEAFESFTKAWEYQQKLGRSPVDYYNNIAWIEKQRGDYRKNHEHMVEAVESIPEGYAPQSTADVYTSLVEAKLFLADSVYFDLTNERNKLYREALPYAQSSWQLADSVNSGNVKLKSAEILALVNAKLNWFQEAFKYSQIARELSDEINDQARTDAIARMTTEFETERIEDENALLQETQKRQVAQLKQQRYLILGGLSVLVLVAAITIIIQRNRIKLKKANTIVQKSLEEKELLLKEIHHRVKNNLQVVSSLLDLQSRDIEDEKALSTFMEGQNRVKAMALIHQKLYQNEDLATIDFAEYAEQLMAELATIYPSSGEVATKISAQGKSNFDIDTAIPLGLILNELISNAYKYAFGESKGELNVSIESLGSGKHQLTVSDTGQGLPADFDIAKAKSLGLRLVRRLSKQLYGSAEYYYEQGSKFIITFTDTLERKSI
ncbi:MAG: tetratricopeptide repeat protein [Roseivirga sp.]|uniref:tetratricopeptide repeat-containing sensor histidine kinase n=1 Tax=Roseivirga sp. TaxID=1964215 RepID=UPI001B28632D|nr:histidine kinase dimerization/phosphoacceptor domain -containing protein [Roseivirga sp.]MBO6496027.1 tetratricopeptide repeat protein [Roseivirga sp.]